MTIAAPPRVSLFQPITFRGVTARNRIAVSPMCQYSAADGADLPASRTIAQSAEMLFGAGETMDVKILRPQAERLILGVTRVAPNPVVFLIRLTVR